jgi:AAA family ATP:ADP antiporter
MTNNNKNLVTRFMKTATKIEANEIRAALLSFSFIFTLMASYYILRPIRDAMSSNWTDAELSTLYTGTFIFSTIAVVIYGQACSRIKIGHVVPGVYALFAVSFVGFYLAMQSGLNDEIVNKAFFIWVSVFSVFNVSVFWSFMADIFNKEQATRLFAFVASGSSVGALVGPVFPIFLINVVGRTNLLLISAILLLVPMVLIGILERIKHTDLHNDRLASEQDYEQKLGTNPFAGFKAFFENRYLFEIGVFILCYVTISTFVYFELKNLMVGVDEITRVQIWAGMDWAVNLLAIGTAMFGASRLSTRFGVTKTLTLVPAAIAIGLLGVAMAPMLWIVVGLQVVRRAGNYAITRPCREMLFTVVDRESRFKAKSVIDTVVYRGGDMITAWAFTGLTQGIGLGLGVMAGIGALVAVKWAFVARYLGRTYESNNATPDLQPSSSVLTN